MQPRSSGLIIRVVLAAGTVVGVSAGYSPVEAATTAQPTSADVLFQLAQDDRRAGEIDHAIHERRTLLLADTGQALLRTAVVNDRDPSLETSSVGGGLAWNVNGDSQLDLEYGVTAFAAPAASILYDPEGDFYPTLDTEHLLRLVYTSMF